MWLSATQYSHTAITVDSASISFGDSLKGAPASHKCKHGLTSSLNIKYVPFEPQCVCGGGGGGEDLERDTHTHTY